MSGPGVPRVDVVADLVVTVDGSPVTVTADGAEVLVSLADPVVVLDNAATLPGALGLSGRGLRRGLAELADRAAAAGLDVVVSGPSGVLVTVGPHARTSRPVRLLAGSDRVGLGSWATVRGPLLGVARRRAVRLVARLRARRSGRPDRRRGGA